MIELKVTVTTSETRGQCLIFVKESGPSGGRADQWISPPGISEDVALAAVPEIINELLKQERIKQ